MWKYEIDQRGVVIFETTLPEFCAECDEAEWTVEGGELTCKAVKRCARFFDRLAERQTWKTQVEPIATKAAGTLQVGERQNGIVVDVTIDRQQTKDRLAIDEARGSQTQTRSTDKEAPLDWMDLPRHLTGQEFGWCAGISRSCVAKSLPPELLAKYGTWARLPKKKGRAQVGIMIDERALDEWKDRPRGRGRSRNAACDYDEAIALRWVRGENPPQIAKELGITRAFVRRRVRDIFKV